MSVCEAMVESMCVLWSVSAGICLECVCMQVCASVCESVRACVREQ